MFRLVIFPRIPQIRSRTSIYGRQTRFAFLPYEPMLLQGGIMGRMVSFGDRSSGAIPSRMHERGLSCTLPPVIRGVRSETSGMLWSVPGIRDGPIERP
jgi:hypothetical protein